MTARLPDHLIELPDPSQPTAARRAHDDLALPPVDPETALPVGHPDRCDAAEIRRLSWRRRRNVRTTVFRHRLGSVEVRP